MEVEGEMRESATCRGRGEEGEDMKDGREYGAQPGRAIPWSVPRRSQGLT